MFKRKKQQQPEQENPLKLQTPTVPTAKATVKTMGTGDLEFSENTLKFTLKKSLLGRQKDVAIKIPVSEIETVRQDGNRFVVLWNGITDTFTLQKPEYFKPILEKLTAALDEVKRTQAPTEEQTPEQKERAEAEQQMRLQVPMLLNSAEEIVDPLFDLLRTLQGKINWTRVEEHLKKALQSVEAFTDLNSGKVNVNFAKLSAAVKAHVPVEAGGEVLGLLRQLSEYFVGLASKQEVSAQVHPNYRDAQNALRAYYTLNDIVLGVEVGDEETVKESYEFSRILDQLAKEIQVPPDAGLLKETVGKLARAKSAEDTVVECRALLRAHLSELTKSAAPSVNLQGAEIPRES
jgi:hypothetical protein